MLVGKEGRFHGKKICHSYDRLILQTGRVLLSCSNQGAIKGALDGKAAQMRMQRADNIAAEVNAPQCARCSMILMPSMWHPLSAGVPAFEGSGQVL